MIFGLDLFPSVFFFKQKTAYEIGTGDWSSDVCSSDLLGREYILVTQINNTMNTQVQHITNDQDTVMSCKPIILK